MLTLGFAAAAHDNGAYNQAVQTASNTRNSRIAAHGAPRRPSCYAVAKQLPTALQAHAALHRRGGAALVGVAKLCVAAAALFVACLRSSSCGTPAVIKRASGDFLDWGAVSAVAYDPIMLAAWQQQTSICCMSAACCRLLPQEMVINSYVVDTSSHQQQQQDGTSSSSSSSAANGTSGSSSSSIVSMVSFYTLPSSILGHDEHKELKAAYMFYTGALSA